jgi:SAM-dependent methyltransferase
VSGPQADEHRAERRRIRRLFNRAAGVLAVFDGHLRREYVRALQRVELPPGLEALDLGTGTGNLAAALAARGHRVTGLDFSERSLARARRSCPDVRPILADLFDLDAVRDRSVDLVALAYVLHGLPVELRQTVLNHAARIARQAVLVLDYAGHGPWYVRLIEFFEGPHYPSFAARPVAELLAAAGLAVVDHGVTSPTGGYWLARPARPRELRLADRRSPDSPMIGAGCRSRSPGRFPRRLAAAS